ncbi:TRAP transporter, 4TM/12TM fusion protein [Thioalkalivibrio sulfidiphilus HL-EbGr7]|uniref:TRAP transporter, 4TM/12TM fusion protein n=1 Tax=Thioalkalivibrio sulfidiphilus (strain HL-EbGR7) TaxID=396588 RepID=B8GRK1_THISH|nr:TRAP transporter fused permease subunit [Thioalkalivibrio sulfidiphilus]ACL72555.1 TRAP transporter, 4TM/12TM fusion protein [Thioalkalivibrio sulfidiphilus HL-EbGr7]
MSLLKKTLTSEVAYVLMGAAFLVALYQYLFSGETAYLWLVAPALALQIVHLQLHGRFYPGLSAAARQTLTLVYLGVCLYALYHLWPGIHDIGTWRQIAHTDVTLYVGLALLLLAAEMLRQGGVLTLRNLTFILGAVLFVSLMHYFLTGAGGQRYLAVRLVPLAMIIQILYLYQNQYLYSRLPALINHTAVIVYIGICLYTTYYLTANFEDIAIWRQAAYTTHDFVVGVLIFLVVMELSRLIHPVLFWVNVVLVFYALWGHLSPIDFFWHPSVNLDRIITSSTVEFSTGVYGRYSQLSLTLIAAFLLLAAVASGFGAQRALVDVMRRLAGRSRHTIPQTAVLASVSVGMVSGSGSANTAVTGSFTIPLMKRYGVPGTFAGAVETAASMGGLIMPPLMAVAGFLMAEFLGVPYWDVVVRGFAVAFVYFVSLILAVYLLSVRLLPSTPIQVPTVPLYDWMRTTIFFSGIIFLILLMSTFGYGALRAALYTAGAILAMLLLTWLYFKYVLKDPKLQGETLLGNLRTVIETHAEMTAYLTLLMATLGIMIGLFTVTGFITRMGSLLLQLGDFHIVAMILMAWIFGWLVGTGLPPTATYIIVAVIIVPPLRQMGVDPWVAHFFAFLLAIWGELSPPTSLTAAVAAKIAEASFMKTMWEALKICLPITIMSFAIFVRSDMVVNPGWAQITDTLLVAAGTAGVTFATFGRFFVTRLNNWGMRIFMLALSLVVVFYPHDGVATVAAVIVVPLIILGVIRHRTLAAPPEVPSASAATGK